MKNYGKTELFTTIHTCVLVSYSSTTLNDSATIAIYCERYHTTKIIHLLQTKINFISFFIHFRVCPHSRRPEVPSHSHFQEEDDAMMIFYIRERERESELVKEESRKKYEECT